MAITDFAKTGLDKLNVIFLLDTSGSMEAQRMAQLNNGMSVSLSAIQEEAEANEIALSVRVVEFNNNAEWIIGKTEEGEDIDDAVNLWTDLTTKYASTNTAAAIRLAKECMHTKYLGERAYSPLVILVTDGVSDDPAETKVATEELRNSLKSKSDPNKDKITRIAVGVVGANQAELEMFASIGTIVDDNGTHENVPLVFNVNNVKNLANLLKNVTKSSVVSSITGKGAGNIIVENKEDDQDDVTDEEWED